MRRFIFLIAFSIILFCVAVPASAQGGIGIAFITPLDGQTYYAGPSTLVYSINITGQVTGVKGDPSNLDVRLEVFQGTTLVNTIVRQTKADGSFVFDFTVNPEGSDPAFTVDMVTRGCSNIGPISQCHYRATVSLPAGQVLLRATLIVPGVQASAERRISVDRAKYINIPVRVVRADAPDKPIAGVKVIGSTWLYQWRMRSATGVTGADGRADVPRAEVLSQAPTQYVFNVDPSVVDGVLYEGVEPVEFTLPANATSAPLVTLRAHGKRGQISGTVKGEINAPITVHAILLPSGKSFSTQANAGNFVFPNLPVGQYLVGVDGSTTTPQTIDLKQTPSASITLAVARDNVGKKFAGVVREAKGVLPFAWFTPSDARIAERNAPDTGTFAFTTTSHMLIVSAPGYFTQAHTIDALEKEFTLVRRPETRSIAWGNGEIVVPPESQVRVNDRQFTLEYGWLWGNGGDDPPLTIRISNAEIVLPRGRFAIEFVPENTGWLYVIDGQANVSATTGESFIVRGGEMLAMSKQSGWMPVPIDASVLARLRPATPSPIAPIWELSLSAQVRDRLAQTGISVAQMLTLATYTAVILVFVLIPLGILFVRGRNNPIG
jgi:hypothetical protein